MTDEDKGVSFNVKMYSSTVKSFIGYKRDDHKFICNQLAKLYKKIDDYCTDSCRVSVCNEDGSWSEAYENAITCCGQANRKITNPYTGNSYWIGFNYGH